MMEKIIKKSIIFVVIISILHAPAYSATKAQITAGNILGTAFATLLRGVIEGNVKSWNDVGRCLIWGGVSGAGFTSAKSLVSDGKLSFGIILANISSSLVENVSCGDHPFSHIRYSFGPLRINIKTPLSKYDTSCANFDISIIQVINFARAIHESDKVMFKHGIFIFESSYHEDYWLAWTKSLYPIIGSNTSPYYLRHECIHVIQNLQIQSVSPEPFLNIFNNNSNSLIKFSGFRIGSGEIINRIYLNSLDYESMWNEKEAHYFVSYLD